MSEETDQFYECLFTETAIVERVAWDSLCKTEWVEGGRERERERESERGRQNVDGRRVEQGLCYSYNG